MSDGSRGEDWGAFLTRVTSGRGRSVAKLARESGISKAAIFDWKRGGTGESVKISSILAIADAAGEDPLVALRAAAGLVPSDPDDEEIGMVLKSNLADHIKQEIIDSILDRRERDRWARMQDTMQMMKILGGDQQAS